MDSHSLDLTHLPEIFALSVLIGCFRPLVRRAGPHVNLWFTAWLCLLFHFVALSCLPLGSIAVGQPLPWLSLLDQCSLDLALIIFAYAAETSPTLRIQPVLVSLIIAALFCQSAISVYPAESVGLHRLAVLLFLAPGLYILMVLRKPTRQSYVFGLACLILAGLAIAFDPGQALIVIHTELTLLLLSAAFLFLRSSPNPHRGVMAAITGMAAWALTLPVTYLLAHLAPTLRPRGALLSWPIFLMAGGIILTLLQEHICATERLAMHDPLTDLPNRRMFVERLEAALAEARAERTTVACLVIDVDNFKTINDTLGHDAGDQILRALATRLAWHISPRDVLARTGGDEFTALLAGVHNEHHLGFVASAMMSATSVPVLVDNQQVDVRISIGIALSPHHADDMEGLRKAADQAMYSAKRRGGSLLAYAGEE